MSGIETLHYNSKDNKKIATYIQDELIRSSGAVNRGTKVRTDLAVLNGTKMPAVLLELGFITNSNEVGRLMDSNYQDLLMEQILENINTTPIGHVLKKIASLPEVRKEKVLNVRRQITEGKYDLNERLDIVLDRVLEDLTA